MADALRPASVVMSARRAGAVVPNALSFARSAMRELVRGRWRIEKLRFDLDAEGRGEILYRLVGGTWRFHFFLLSIKLPEEQKLDRNWAQAWDAMGVLCQGEWTAEREARLRIEVPKQRSGFADYDTLVYARGNRSGRIFDHVVDSLAAGRQPDADRVAGIGYLLRTTAFIANGQLGTRSFAGLEPDHPLRRPYHVQMCSAFVLREYVFDLVDHMARARNPAGARLDASYRRYLGLGNAAATGLVPFIVNHPQLLHRWCLTHESALGTARRRAAAPGDEATRHFGRLLDRAIQYFGETGEPGDDLFATAPAVAAGLQRVRALFAEYQSAGTMAGADATLPWGTLTEWASRHLRPEALEVLDSLVLELYPDIVEAGADAFRAEERLEVRPEMTLEVLRNVLRNAYGWVREEAFLDPTQSYFWYRSSQAPRDVRRGLRGLAREYEAETGMDTVLQVRALWHSLESGTRHALVADLLQARPDLRHIVARVQSLAGFDYAELRVNWLSKTFSPFEPIRFVLAFYGMEKFEAALPKSVRGSFLQGAPIAEDVEQGIDGVWPYPLKPTGPTLSGGLAALPPAGLGAVRDRPPPPVSTDRILSIAPRELARTVQTMLQARGAALGVAEEAANIALFAQACGHGALSALLDPHHPYEDSLRVAPAALDLACARALTSAEGIGTYREDHARAPEWLGELVLRCAGRGLVGLLMWRTGFALSAPDPDGPWYVYACGQAPDKAAIKTLLPAALAHVDAQLRRDRGFVLACMRPETVGDGLFDAANARKIAGTGIVWGGAELLDRRAAWERQGLAVDRDELDALYRAAGALLVPASEVQRLRPQEDIDPLKVF